LKRVGARNKHLLIRAEKHNSIIARRQKANWSSLSRSPFAKRVVLTSKKELYIVVVIPAIVLMAMG